MLTITRHPHGCLMVFPRPEWEKFRERIAQLPMSAQGWKRIFMGYAMDVDMDATGRVLVSPELRQAAGITKDAILLGMGNHLELWDKAMRCWAVQAMRRAAPGSTPPLAGEGIRGGSSHGSRRRGVCWRSTRTPKPFKKQRASRMRAFPFGTRDFATWRIYRPPVPRVCSWIWA